MIAGKEYLKREPKSNDEEKDITTQKILLEIGKNINGLFKRHLQHTPQSIFVLDWSLEIIYMNPAFERLTGLRKEDMVEGRMKFSVHPDDRKKIESSVIMAIVGKTTQCQCRIRGSQDSYHDLALSISPLHLDERCLVLCLNTGSNPEKI